MIRPHQVHLWIVDPRAGAQGGHVSVLDRGERAARDRLVFPAHRERYESRHTVLRRALSWCLPAVGPEQWRFRVGPHGKPTIDSPRSARRLRFNVSHTTTWMAVVVTLDRPCGIDIEDAHRSLDVEPLARLALDERELSELVRAPAADRRTEFLRTWTLKEAYLKARGIGMSIPLTAIGTARTAAGPRLRPGPGTPDADIWRLDQWIDRSHLVLSVAVHAAPRAALTFHRHREVSPPQSPAWPPAEEGTPSCIT